MILIALGSNLAGPAGPPLAQVEAALAALGERRVKAPSSQLSERELEVLRHVARGKTNKEIASTLGLSARTVQHHTIHIYEKLGVDEVLSPLADKKAFGGSMIDYNVRAERMGWLPSAPQLKTNPMQVAKDAAAAGMDPKLMVQLPDGRTFSAPTEKDAELIRNQIAQGKSFKATLDEIAKTSPGLADQFLNWIGYTTPTQAQFNGLAQSAVDKFRPATSGSTAEMGDPSQRALRSTLARAPGESGAAYADRLRRMGQQADVGLNSTLTAIGQAPIINATPRK
jgi:DNA-binding CsgD family transcriptional regulator